MNQGNNNNNKLRILDYLISIRKVMELIKILSISLKIYKLSFRIYKIIITIIELIRRVKINIKYIIIKLIRIYQYKININTKIKDNKNKSNRVMIIVHYHNMKTQIISILI